LGDWTSRIGIVDWPRHLWTRRSILIQINGVLVASLREMKADD